MKLFKMGIVTGLATVGLIVLPLTTANAASAPHGFKLQTVLVAGNSNKHKDSHSTPETPYASIFPLVIAGATWFVYRKRRRQQA